jgi:hypothetical protein
MRRLEVRAIHLVLGYRPRPVIHHRHKAPCANVPGAKEQPSRDGEDKACAPRAGRLLPRSGRGSA